MVRMPPLNTYRMKRKGKHLPGGSIPGYMVLAKPEKKSI
jgi:hypothetical protein